MSEKLDELKREASQLSESERVELAYILIESLDPPGESPDIVDEAWRVEIERRSAEVRRGDVKPIPGDEVFARLHRDLNAGRHR
ncbi:MAG: addiction module protein [Chloroflexota bacterium]